MATSAQQDLLTPEILGSVAGLQLLARVISDTINPGLIRSVRPAPGMEFSQYRAYLPGDDPRLLDWKMLARSERYFIKESERESLVTVKFVLDASASMLHTEKGLNKWEYTRALVATLAYMVQKQGDSIGLYAIGKEQRTALYPRTGGRQFNRLLTALIGLEPEGSWPQRDRVARQLSGGDGRELILFFTDFYQEEEELLDFIRGLKSPRNEVVVCRVMGRDELEFSHKQPLMFEDLETGMRVEVDPGRARKAYLDRVNHDLEQLRSTLLNQGIEYYLFRMGDPLEDTLRHFLKEREQTSRR